jgi:acetyl-CoA C-acetyltransferase
MTLDPRTPVLVGVGQTVSHWRPGDEGEAPSPQGLRAAATRAALADSGAAQALAAMIDRVVVVRTMLDSVPGAPQPFGRCTNPPGTLAADAGLSPREAIYSVVGGDQPQTLVNEAAAAIFAGECRAVLLSGAEATAAMKAALKAGMALDWSASADGECEDRGLGPMLLSPYEIANGLGAPTQTYPAFEHALAARLGNDRAAHRQLMSRLWAGFSRVAARNPFAQFPVARDEAFLSTPGADNYLLADPYLKWDVAQDAVNQGAALILTSAGEADRLGIPPARRVHLHGHASAKDRTPSERPDLSRSLATELVLCQTLEGSGCTAADIAHIDLYSCFPVAVLLAAEALGIDPATDPERLTLTGGLPFFGGAGNNYSMHAIAEAVSRCRAQPGSRALVLANGGFLSKEAAGIYSTAPLPGWQPQSSAAIQSECDAQTHPPLLAGDCEGTLESFTVTYARGEAQRGYAFLRTDDGARLLARTEKGEAALLAAATGDGVTGQRLRARQRDGINMLDFAGEAA